MDAYWARMKLSVRGGDYPLVQHINKMEMGNDEQQLHTGAEACTMR